MVYVNSIHISLTVRFCRCEYLALKEATLNEVVNLLTLQYVNHILGFYTYR